MKQAQIPVSAETSYTVLARLISKWEADNLLKFNPSKAFYERLHINKVRFSQLVSGRKQPVSTEIKALADFFKVPVKEFIQ